ncbi:MAG TPA: ABC transporter substrate-binding protein [Stellaceae bacterium]|jgi:phospholipid transport system substrate-binding protein|nr:ABC transporter substrate-binding protein [Stellaceae bacterium]
MSVSRRSLLISPLALGCLAASAAAEGEAGATAAIGQLYDALLGVMKQAKSMSFDQRFARLLPVIERVFDLGLMTRIAVGPSWPQIAPAAQQRLTQAFARFTVSQYAGRFDGYDGERFEVDPAALPNPNGVIVQSRLVKSNGEPVALNYLMHRGAGGAWQAIDVYLKGTISELATRRSEFAGVLQSSGADGLVKALDQRSAALRAG